MDILGKLFGILKMTGEMPSVFGKFHIFSLVIIAAVTVFVCIKIKSPSERTVRRFLMAVSLIVIVFELYKQLVYSFSFNGERFIFDYKWQVFPWQFCSTPMFAGLGAAIIRKKEYHMALCAYLSSYSLVAGLIISLFPYSVYSHIIGVNIQTTVCHGLMVTVGIFLLWSGYLDNDTEAFKSAIGVFIFGAVVAAVLNQAAYLIGIPEGEVFDMYFISPYFPDDVEILAPLRKNLPDPIFQTVYLTLFTILSAAVFWGVKRIKPILTKRFDGHNEKSVLPR